MTSAKLRVNPFKELIGIRTAVGDGTCSAALDSRAAICVPGGRIADGALCTLADIAMGHAVGSVAGGARFATVHLSLTRVRQEPVSALRAEASVLPLDARWKRANVRADVFDDRGEIVAWALGVFARRPPIAGEEKTLPAPPPSTARDFGQLLGYRSDARRWSVRDELRNPAGVAHGGAVASVLQEAMRVEIGAHAGAASLCLLQCEVSYMLPVLQDSWQAAPVVERVGQAIHFASARLIGSDGAVRAAASGVFAAGG